MAIDKVRVNGNQVSWGSIILKANGEEFTGFTDISYGDKRERTEAYGAGRHQAPRGRSRGKYSCDPCKISGWKASVQDFRAFLAAQAPDGVSYGDVPFQGTINYVEDDETPMTIELVDCVWVSNSSSESEGGDPLKEDFEIKPLYIKRNGLTLFDNSDGIR